MGAIEDTLRRYPQSPVVRDVLGTWEATEIDALVRELVPGADSVFHFECSIGALFGVRLRDGRRVALKVHVRVAEEYLDAMQRVQSHLAARGFPCPRPLARRGPATVEEWVDHGSYRDAHEPGVRRAMAATLARLHALAREQEARPRRAFLVDQESSLWPTPHNALFDFGATADGAEWIDEVAREARAARGAVGETVVGHTDWSVKHLRFDDGLRPTVVYDWDSLHTGLEPHLVGIAAATFTYTEHLPVQVWPEPAEARAFLDEYEQARGTPFAPAERRAAEAAAVYSSAYGARCTHAVGGDAAAGPLRAYAEAFL